MATESKHKVPTAALPKLRDSWLRAYGAAQASEAARQVSNQMFAVYQQQFTAYLEAMNLDASKRWWLDFETGEVSNEPPPEQQNPVNGTMS